MASQYVGLSVSFLMPFLVQNFNIRWTMIVAISLLFLSTISFPALVHANIWLGAFARLINGFMHSVLRAFISAIAMNWFVPDERFFAISMLSLGRYIGKYCTVCFSKILGY